MKINNRFFVYPLILMGMILTLTNSCEKDEKVIKKDPIITWANPTDIFFGTPLSETQLNATADVAGTFVYTPAIGTVLGIGDGQNLNVDFIPTDARNYNNSSKTIAINVKELIAVTDYDGNVYHIIVIGTQTWMVENLKVTHYRNGDLLPNITDNSPWYNLTTGAYCWYNNDISNKTSYGALYNWLAITDSRNIAPTGWHVPTDAEWTTLTAFLGGENVAGGKLKEIGLSHWQTPNTGANNSSGFTALPGGYRELDGDFRRIGLNPGWWSSTEANTDHAWIRYLGYDYNSVTRYAEYKKFGLSVRCVKD